MSLKLFSHFLLCHIACPQRPPRSPPQCHVLIFKCTTHKSHLIYAFIFFVCLLTYKWKWESNVFIQANSNQWLKMTHIWGANWVIIAGPLRGPFSVKLTTLSTGKTLSARDVIPRNWTPRATYTSRLNF